jgi:hypothetical protein
MASIASAGTSPSPLLGFEYTQNDSTSDPDDNLWTMVPLSGSAVGGPGPSPGSAGFFPSPASGSMSSWAFVDAAGQLQASPGALSPLNLDYDPASQVAASSFPTTSYAAQASQFAVATAGSAAQEAQFMAGLLPQDGQDFLTAGNLLFNDQFQGECRV